MKGLLLAALVAGSVLLLAGPALAATYYVDQNHPKCDDRGPGTTEDTPWCTLHRAVDGIPSRERGGIAGSFAPVQAGDRVYVKNGSYVDVQGSSGFITAYRPTNSGTADAPIVFRAYTPPTGPRHTPVLHRSSDSTSEANDAYAVIGSAGRNYIIWDGFVLAPGTTALTGGDGLTTGIGNVFENLDINFGIRPCAPGNPASIYIAGATYTTVRNNRIRGALYGSASEGCHQANARGIYLINTGRNLIHNNEISDAGQGIGIKRTSYNNIFELNYIHDVKHEGIGLGATGCSPETAPTCATHSNVVRNNIIAKAEAGVGAGAPGPTSFFNNHIYNNTLFLVRSGISVGAPDSTSLGGLRHYNNIIYLNLAIPGRHGHIMYWNGTPADLLSDYSVFYTSSGRSGHFYPVAFGPAHTLSQWQRIPPGLDRYSRLVDPLFVGPLGGAPRPPAFHLQPQSPARNAGRLGGLSSEAHIDTGAYATGAEVIGLPAR